MKYRYIGEDYKDNDVAILNGDIFEKMPASGFSIMQNSEGQFELVILLESKGIEFYIFESDLREIFEPVNEGGEEINAKQNG